MPPRLHQPPLHPVYPSARITDAPPAHLPALRADVVRGLVAVPKELPPKWLYDERGSELFEQISRRCPEYYPARAERALIGEAVAEIAAYTDARTLVELGSGSSEKTPAFLDALDAVRAYVPVDVSGSALEKAAARLAAAYPSVGIRPHVADFTDPLDLQETDGPRLVMFLGGTLGNLLPAERAAFLIALASQLAPRDRLLLGVHLVTDPGVIVPAYDDAAGLTAQFNAGILHRINRELGGDFDPDGFEHIVHWDEENSWVEMRLRARSAQTVTLLDPGIVVRFAAGEDLRTEVSAKFRPEGLAAEAAAAGLELTASWADPDRLVCLALLSPSPGMRADRV